MTLEGVTTADLKTTLENLFAQMLRRHAEISNITIKRERVIVVQFEKMIDKIDVLRNRYNYIGKAMGITIFPDETPRERKMIDEIKRRAMEETLKGQFVKMSYRSIFVNERKYVWSELQDRLVEAVNRPRTASIPYECGKRPQNARADSRSYRTSFFYTPTSPPTIPGQGFGAFSPYVSFQTREIERFSVIILKLVTIPFGGWNRP